MTVSGSELLDRAKTWLAEDPDPETREELAKLIEAGDLESIGERFSERFSSARPGCAASWVRARCG